MDKQLDQQINQHNYLCNPAKSCTPGLPRRFARCPKEEGKGNLKSGKSDGRPTQTQSPLSRAKLDL